MQYISGPYTQGQLIKDINGAEISLTNRFDRSGVITDAAEQRSWRERIEDCSFGRNTVMYDDQGNPSVMVAIQAFQNQDVLTGGGTDLHPAFLVNGVFKPVIYVSKYQNYTTGSGATLRAIGLKHKDPGTYINFDNALLSCKQKGSGWHLMSNAEWAAIALQCKAKGFQPRGNNNYGKDHGVATEKGVCSYIYSNNVGRVLTGSGPITWSHDGSPFGVYDLNGNVWEWTGGMRINAGEIQVLENNNAADNTKDQTAASTMWRAILPTGTLCHTKWVTGTAYALNTVIAPNNGKTYICTTAGASGAAEPTWPTEGTITDGTAVWTYQADLTLKYDGTNPPVINTTVTTYASANTPFESLAAASGVTVPNIMKLLALAPIDTAHSGDRIYIDSRTEKIALRGGDWDDSSLAGVFLLLLGNARSDSRHGLGFRSAFVP